MINSRAESSASYPSEMGTPSPIVDTLTKLRKAARESQQDVAEALGVRQPTVSSWEQGKHSPPLWQLLEWADRYGFTVTLEPTAEAPDRLRRLLAAAAALPDGELDDVLAFVEHVSEVDPTVRGAAVALMSSMVTAKAKSA